MEDYEVLSKVDKELNRLHHLYLCECDGDQKKHILKRIFIFESRLLDIARSSKRMIPSSLQYLLDEERK